MNNANYIQIIVLLLFVGFSVLSWVFRKLQEQAQVRRVQMERERRQMEMLRTGKPGENEPPPAAPTSDAERLRDLAARRQAQLQELRRRAQERVRAGQGRPQQPSREPPPLIFIPGTTGPTVPQQRPGQRPAARSRVPQPAPARTPVPARPGRATPGQDQRARQPQPVPRPPQPTRRRDDLRRLTRAPEPAPPPAVPVAPAPPATARGAPHRPAGGVLLDPSRISAADWRRAIVMNELLSPPLSLREPLIVPGELSL